MSRLKLAIFFSVKTFSFSVLNSITGDIIPCMVLVLSIYIVIFSENSICEYIDADGSITDINKYSNRFIFL